MAEAVRNRFTPRKRDAAVDALIAIILNPEAHPEARIRAFDVVTKKGWADEARLNLGVPEEGSGEMIVRWGGDGN